MPEINLIKQKSASEDFVKKFPRIMNWILIGILILAVAFYAWIFFQAKATTGKITELKNQIEDKKTAVLNEEKRGELLTRQLQLQQLSGLIRGHIYWSDLLPKLAKVTLKTANYQDMEISTETGKVTLSARVPSLEELDKYLQVFNDPSFNKNFYNVKLGSFSKVQENDTTSINFKVIMEFNKDLIHR